MFGIKLKIGTKSTKLENFREIEKKIFAIFFFGISLVVKTHVIIAFFAL